MLTDEELAEKVKGFDLYDPDLQDDPYSVMGEIRERCPVAHAETYGGFWVVSRYADVERVLRDPVVFSSAEMLIPHYEHPLGRQIPLELDPPEHVKYRQVLLPLFGPARVEAILPLIRSTTRRLVDAIVASGRCDFNADFAIPLPSAIFLHSFGIPEERLADLLDYKDKMLRGGLSTDEEAQQNLSGGRTVITSFFADLLEQRRAADLPGDDVVSVLSRATIDGRPWTDQEIIRCLINLMLGSLDTVTTALGNMFAFLVEHPDHRRRIVDDPTVIPNAIEEFLRYESFTYIARLVTTDVELDGQLIRVGERVQLLPGAAGRDPREFTDPDTVDFDRQPMKHLAFGIGSHRCLGIHLARASLRVALEEWHAHIPTCSLAPGTVIERRLGHVRGVNAMHLVLDGG